MHRWFYLRNMVRYHHAFITMTMNNTRSNNKRIAKNSFLLYIRMVIVMIVNLYTVRVVLNALGNEDYGIFNVVAGIVTMMNSVSYVLSTSTQRFYTVSIGKKSNNLQDIFSVSTNIYLVFAMAILLLGETVGLWFVNTQLVIPECRMIAANWVYQFSLFAFVFSIFHCPYSAAVISHEDMGIFAGVNLLECFLKLFIALSISYSPIDSLSYYGGAMMVVPLVSLILYGSIATRKYKDCHYNKHVEISFYRQLLSFSGWNLFSSLASVGMNQLINILINIFFGPIANAARAIAMQVNSAMNSFSSCFITALRPPMTKAYAENNYEYLNQLFAASNKLIYYCMLIIVVPLFVECDYVIAVWLKSTEPLTTLFCRLTLIYALLMVMNNPISIIMQAAGKVKEYFVPVETITILCPFICWGLYSFGAPSEAAFYAMIGATITSHVIRLYCLKKYYSSISMKDYFKGFVIPAIMITIFVFSGDYWLHCLSIHQIVKLVIEIILSLTIAMICLPLFGMSIEEKNAITAFINKIRRH